MLQIFRHRVLIGIFLWMCTTLAAAAPNPATLEKRESVSPSPSPSPTPVLYSPPTLADLKKLQAAALTSDYAYRQVAHLSNIIVPLLSGSAQAQKAVDYVAA